MYGGHHLRHVHNKSPGTAAELSNWRLAKGVRVKGKQAKSATARLLGLAYIYTIEIELRYV